MTAATAIGAPIELALGTVQFGLAYGVVGSGQRVTDDEASAILQAAASAGRARARHRGRLRRHRAAARRPVR
jgi:hypothetical protein